MAKAQKRQPKPKAQTPAPEEELDDTPLDEEGGEGAPEGEESDLEITVGDEGGEPEHQPNPEESIDGLKKRLKDSDALAAQRGREIETLKKEKTGTVQERFTHAEQIINAREGEVDGIIAAKTSKAETLEKEIADLYEGGDTAAALKKQRELNKLDYELAQAEDYKKGLNGKREELKAAKENAEVSERVMGDADYEAAGYLPAARQWIKEHPQFQIGTDGKPLNKFTRVALVAHNEAIDSEDLEEGSPDYFAFINQKLIAKGEMEAPESDEEDLEEEEEDNPPPPPPRKKAPQNTAAPGANRSNASGAGGKRRGRLTAEEAEAAKICGMGHEEYWEYLHGDKKDA